MFVAYLENSMGILDHPFLRVPRQHVPCILVSETFFYEESRNELVLVYGIHPLTADNPKKTVCYQISANSHFWDHNVLLHIDRTRCLHFPLCLFLEERESASSCRSSQRLDTISVLRWCKKLFSRDNLLTERHLWKLNRYPLHIG